MCLITAYDRRIIALYEIRYFPRAPKIILMVMLINLMLIKCFIEDNFMALKHAVWLYEEINIVCKCLLIKLVHLNTDNQYVMVRACVYAKQFLSTMASLLRRRNDIINHLKNKLYF